MVAYWKPTIDIKTTSWPLLHKLTVHQQAKYLVANRIFVACRSLKKGHPLFIATYVFGRFARQKYRFASTRLRFESLFLPSFPAPFAFAGVGFSFTCAQWTVHDARERLQKVLLHIVHEVGRASSVQYCTVLVRSTCTVSLSRDCLFRCARFMDSCPIPSMVGNLNELINDLLSSRVFWVLLKRRVMMSWQNLQTTGCTSGTLLPCFACTLH